MTTPTPPRRRWFRFSLRTMFAVVTAFAVFLAYHVLWIRQRHVYLNTDGVDAWPNFGNVDPPQAPGLLWIFGERGVSLILITEDSQGDNPRAKLLFPESSWARFPETIEDRWVGQYH